jgi:hypothetical protein
MGIITAEKSMNTLNISGIWKITSNAYKPDVRCKILRSTCKIMSVNTHLFHAGPEMLANPSYIVLGGG